MSGSLPAPYDPADEPLEELPHASERSRSVALVLGILGGVFGLHRFYAGRPRSGALMALTVGGMGFWWLYDMVMLVAGEFEDGDGLRIRNWNITDTVGGGGADARTVAVLVQHVEALQRQVSELAERVDFTERLLTQQRERDRLPSGS